MRLAIALALIGAASAWPDQQFTISTLVGSGGGPVPAVGTAIGSPAGIAGDADGNVYVAGQGSVYRLDRAGMLTRVAGVGATGYSGDGGSATSAYLDNVTAITADHVGNIYIAEAGGHIRKIARDGIITTVAGTGICHGGCFTAGVGDGAPALSATLFYPYQLAVDPDNNLYFAEWNTSRVRRISADGMITTVVGTGKYGHSGDGGPASSAQIGAPWGLTFDSEGNLFISDATPGDDVEPVATYIRKVSTDGIISTVAGTGDPAYSGDGGPATKAQLLDPGGLAADRQGNLYVSDGARVRRISRDGIITTIAGNGLFGYSGDGGPASRAEMSFAAYGQGLGLIVNDAGELFIADSGNHRIRKISSDGTIATVAGGSDCCFAGDGGPAKSAQLNIPAGIAVASDGTVYIGDTFNNRVRRINTSGVITTVAGTGVPFPVSGDGGPGISARLAWPTGLKLDRSGNVYIADAGNMRVRRLSPDGTIDTVAGSDIVYGSTGPGYSGDGGAATKAQLSWPKDVAFDGSGNMYIADTGNHVIRKVSVSGLISTFAGVGGETSGSYAGDGGPADKARLNQPSGLAVDSAGNLYIADTENARVRKVDVSGLITTIAGSGKKGYSGDGGPAVQAQLESPAGLAVDADGNLYIGDGASVRMVSAGGIISTIAGNGVVGYAGDGGPSTSAQTGAWGLAFDSAGKLFVADPWDNAIRVLTPAR